MGSKCAQCRPLQNPDGVKFRMLRVCFAYESIGYTPICNARYFVPDTFPPTILESITECPGGRNFCGFDSDLWDAMAQEAGLEENRDWVRVCTGSSAFTEVIEDLAEYENLHIARNSSDATTHPENMGGYQPARDCDVFAAGIVADAERSQVFGIQFTRPILQMPLVSVTYSPRADQSRFDFATPLSPQSWISVLVTMALAPAAVAALDAVFVARAPSNANPSGSCRPGWPSPLFARSLPARVIELASMLASLVVLSAYLANLTASMLVSRLVVRVTNMRQLWGRSVGLYNAYQQTVERTFGLDTTIIAWTQDWEKTVFRLLTSGQLEAFIFYEQAMNRVLNQDTSCSLDEIRQRARLVDTVFAFRRTFDQNGLMVALDDAILTLSQTGFVGDLMQRYEITHETCPGQGSEESVFSPTPLFPLSGAWLVYAAVAGLVMCAHMMQFAARRKRRSAAERHGITPTCRRPQEGAGVYSS